MPNPTAAADAPEPSQLAFDAATIDLEHGHRLYYEQAGNPQGVPIVLLHGGPGSGSSPRQRTFLDPTRFRIVQYDQRGCGRSEPIGETAHNHTAALIEDIERLRLHLGIDRWLVCGGSWGSSLALAYAAAYRPQLSALILRGMFLSGGADIDWFFGGVGALAPEAHAEFLAHVPRRWRRRIVTYLQRSFAGADLEKAARLAAAWQRYENAISAPDIAMGRAASPLVPGSAALRAKYRIQSHYLAQDCFLGQRALLRAASELRDLPVALIHGTLDRVCRPNNAFLIHRACAGSRLAWARGAGHDPFHPATQALLRDAVNRFAAHGDFSHWPTTPEGPLAT